MEAGCGRDGEAGVVYDLDACGVLVHVLLPSGRGGVRGRRTVIQLFEKCVEMRHAVASPAAYPRVEEREMRIRMVISSAE
jgi:hypothetical protein